ncbi:hypothetical protein [Dorea sp.]
MSLNNKKNTQTASDVFDDDFEVIYEGDLPDISIDDDDDDYRDVLSGLSDIDHTDYIRKNDYDRLTKKLKDKNRNQKGKDNFFDTSYYDEDFLDELDDDLYDDSNAMDDDNDSHSGRKKDKSRRKKRGIKVPNVAKPVAKTAKTGGKILFKFINFLLRMGTLLLIAWIIYLLGLHFLTNVGPFGNIISRLTAADQKLIAYLAVAGVLLLYEIIIFFCVLGGSRKQGRDGNTIDNGRGLTSFIIIAAGSYLSAMFASLIPQIPAALQGIQSALTVYGSLKNTLLPICVAGVVSCIIRKFIIK